MESSRDRSHRRQEEKQVRLFNNLRNVSQNAEVTSNSMLA